MNAPVGDDELRFLPAIRVPDAENPKTFICQLFANFADRWRGSFRRADPAGPAVSAG
jgi:hypothetical protein